MCGRTRCTLNPHQVARACGFGSAATVRMDRFQPTYNASPGSYMPVLTLVYNKEGVPSVVEEEEDRETQAAVVQSMKWGLVPSFTSKNHKPDHFRMFNARSESIKEKASFRRLVPKNRCLVAVEGFYEWKKDGSKKQPYYIHFKDQRPLVFAALYDTWVNSQGEVLHTFTILTTSSSSALQWLHDRMPVVLGNETSVKEWLNNPAAKLDLLLRPYEDSDLVWYPVTPSMGKPSFDGPECIKEIQLKTTDSKLISNFFIKKAENVKEQSCLEMQNPVKIPSNFAPSESMKQETLEHEATHEGTGGPSANAKQVEDVTKDADLVEAMKESCCEENKTSTEDPAVVEMKRELEILKSRVAENIKKEVEYFDAMIEGSHDEIGDDRTLEARGVKRDHHQMDETVLSQHPVRNVDKQEHPVVKKQEICAKKASGGQSTLFSFFGKK